MNLKVKGKSLLYALVSAALIAGLLAGCGAKSAAPIPEEVTAADEPATLSAEEAEETTEEMLAEETEEAEQSPETEEELVAEFLNVFSTIAYHSYINHCNVVYDDETKSNLTFALESSTVFYELIDTSISVWNYCAKKFNWPDSYVRDDEYYDDEKQAYVKAPDPLNRFGSAGYCRYDGDKIDWILTNVFNVKPDHSYDSNQHKADKRNDLFDCYYHDGFYYYYHCRHADEQMLNIKMDSKTKDSSGEYKFLLSGYDPNEGKKVSSYTVVAQLNQVDGKKLWKLISVQEKPTEFWQDSLDTADFMDLFYVVSLSRNSIEDFADYGPDSKYKLSIALNYLENPWSGVWYYCSERFHWPESSYQEYGCPYDETIPKKPDPLNQFTQYNAYARFDGDKVDWILENILNVKPDHSYNSKKVKLDGRLNNDIFDCYYHDGYYYFAIDNGCAVFPHPKLDSKTKKSNGDYVFELSEYDLEDGKKNNTYTVTAQLHQVDGYKVWKLISIHQNKIR